MNYRLPRLRRASAALALVVLSLLALNACYPAPDAAGLKAVQKRFLGLRLQAPFDAKLRRLSDMRLFQKACKMERVRCRETLEMLKKSDARFYEQLTRSQEKKPER